MAKSEGVSRITINGANGVIDEIPVFDLWSAPVKKGKSWFLMPPHHILELVRRRIPRLTCLACEGLGLRVEDSQPG